MNVLGRVLGAVALLLLTVLGIGLVLPGRWQVEETATVAVSPDSVSRALGRPSSWREWMPWPESGAEFLGPSFGEGAGFRWDDPTYGSGRFTITESVPERSIRYRVSVEGGSILVRGHLRLEPSDGRTRIRWVERGSVGWNPLLGFAALTMEDRQQEQLRNALRRLEEHLDDGGSDR